MKDLEVIDHPPQGNEGPHPRKIKISFELESEEELALLMLYLDLSPHRGEIFESAMQLERDSHLTKVVDHGNLAISEIWQELHEIWNRIEREHKK